jgi:Fe-S cluster assembly protein SufD
VTAATWLEERRRAASELDTSLPVPTIREEHWRYTNLRGVDFDSFVAAPRTTRIDDSPPTLLYRGDEAGRLIQVDGDVALAELSDDALAKGVTLMSLEQAAVEKPALVSEHLGRIVGVGEKFATENAARWSGGALVHVPKGVELAAPLHVTFALATPQAAQHWRVLVIAEEGARFTLVEEHAEGVPGYANGVVELVIGPAANVEYVTIQSRHRDALHFAHHRAEVDRDAELDWVACTLGARLGKTRMESRLRGEGSTTKLTGTYVLDADRHVDLDTTQEHDAAHTTSDLYFKGVLTDRARAVWRGVIRVAEGAQKTDAYQENRNLLLSPRAHADSIPGLEIRANDVRCTHGATVGQVDQEALHYLMSRGLERPQAERLIVEGFFSEALARISAEPVREAIGAALQARLA